MPEEKWIAGKYMHPVITTYVGDRIELKFSFNKHIIEEVKMMEGAKWHGFAEVNPRKIWSIANSQRNQFQMSFLRGADPYRRFDVPADFKVDFNRPDMREHQRDLARSQLYTRAQIWAAEPGTGKTLASVAAVEQSGLTNILYVAPKNALLAIKRELKIWNAAFIPRFMSYEQMTKAVETQDPYLLNNIPEFLILDESQGYMHPTSKRSQAAKILADRVRETYPKTCHVLLMTGTPSPKDPCGWYWQCEIACPGFLREGDQKKLRRRLALQKMKESDAGGSYPEHITWLDNERKCANCGLLPEQHDTQFDCLYYRQSVNEIAKLGRRLKGLVNIKLKKDCLDLPDKIYQRIYCPVSKELQRASRIIAKTSPTVIQALTRQRELSDGFQYEEHDTGSKQPCSGCGGSGHHAALSESREAVDCWTCGGTGKEPIFQRQTLKVDSPKDDALRGLLDSHEDIGRLVVFAAYQASVDRCVAIAQDKKWLTIRVDGRGWDVAASLAGLDPLDCFQLFLDRFPKICFIGHPGSAGVSLTLTASPSIVYFSNTFNAVERLQSEDRIHRMSQKSDHPTIYDLIHLSTDELVLENIQKKRDLQAITMGDMDRFLQQEGERL